MDIRQLHYLAALARERHFTRAAAACNVTQPTLSGAIRQLEQDLGVAIVERGKRYHGLTPEGEIVLRWAHRIIEDRDNLLSELARMAGRGAGHLTIGVIPSALPAVPPLGQAMRHHSGTGERNIGFTILSKSSEEIRRGVEDFSLDAGITYTDNEPVGPLLMRPLYREHYRLFVRRDHPLADRAQVTWAEVAHHPLCALTPDMQNRRIIDAAFRAAGVRPEPEVESNSVVNLAASVRLDGIACILPEAFIGVVADRQAFRVIPVVEPEISYQVGLVVLDREPLPGLVAEALKAAEGYVFPGDLTRVPPD